MRVTLGIALSFAFVFIIMGLATIAVRLGWVKGEGSRKIIHIGVSNWWFIAVLFFDSWWQAIIVPAIFIVLNALSYRKRIFSAMERGAGLKDLGTVYYAVSLSLLAAFSFSLGKPWIGGMGILAMGWGDGLAAVVGPRLSRPRMPGSAGKSLSGSLTVFVASLIVALAVFRLGLGVEEPLRLCCVSLACALYAALAEAYTPLGFDNLSLPLGVSALAWFLTVGGPWK